MSAPRTGILRRFACPALALCLGLLAALVFTPLTNALYAGLSTEPDLRPADAIVLLTSETYAPGIAGREGYQRMFHALRLYRQGLAPRVVVSGGGAGPAHPPAAEVLGGLLCEAGVPEADILLETESDNTYENLRNITGLMRERGIGRVLLVTSSWHMPRALAVARKLGIDASPAPVPAYQRNISHPGLRYRFVWDILREYAALVYFKLRGWA